MAVGLFPEMAENVFQPLLRRLATDNPDQDFSPNEIREFVFGCGIGAALLEHLIEDFRKILRQGMEKRKLQSLQAELLEVVESVAGEVYARVRDIAATNVLPQEERQASLEAIKRYMKQAKSIGEELQALEFWLKRPRPSVDNSGFAGQKATADYHGYEDSSDIEARLKAGGDM